MNRTAFTRARLVVVPLLVALGNPAPAAAAIDMSGDYVNPAFPSCRITFVQTGTALQVTGLCSQSNPLSAAGTIDPDTGVFSITGEITGLCTTWDISGTADGEMFTGTYACGGGGSGPITATKCLNGVIDSGEECQDGNFIDGDCCSSRCRLEASGSACTNDLNACTDDVCDGAGTCGHVPNAAPCDDGNPCTAGDVCASGTCASGEPNTAPCDDGNPCTAGDVCASGTCVSGAPVPAACAQGQACERTVARMLSSCIARVGARMRRCYLETGAACPPGDSGTAKVLAKVAASIGAQCPDAATVQTLGYGTAATPATVTARVQEACTGEVAASAARTFGGPQGALLTGAGAPTVTCLSKASRAALKLVIREANLRALCIAKAHGLGKSCDVAATNTKIATVESTARDTISVMCPDLKATTGLDAAMHVARAGAQARCVTAATHGNSGPLALDCGPRAAVKVPPRETWTQVILDEATYGTRCGDGSPYAFWLRLPPTGSPSENVVVYVQGGGLCIFESDCALASPLLSATNDPHPSTGILSTNAAVNPFSDWTMVYLPYCTQDLHTGGGITDIFPGISVHRFGAINLRAALRYVRDVLWQDLGATEPEGYRPDRLTVLFGGVSSGGFGVNYNYHYLLDDLRWLHTTAVPDAGLALDNGQLQGLQGLGIIVQAETGNIAWGGKPYQPPYCLNSTCFIGPVLQAATSPRLKAVPEQQILNVSNQVDNIQVGSTFFPSTVAWINALRAAYCANQGLDGIRNWLPAQSTSFHGILGDEPGLSTVTAAGETLPMFLAAAIADPDAVTDHVDEGTLVTDYPGVDPIPCL